MSQTDLPIPPIGGYLDLVELLNERNAVVRALLEIESIVDGWTQTTESMTSVPTDGICFIYTWLEYAGSILEQNGSINPFKGRAEEPQGEPMSSTIVNRTDVFEAVNRYSELSELPSNLSIMGWAGATLDASLLTRVQTLDHEERRTLLLNMTRIAALAIRCLEEHGLPEGLESTQLPLEG